MIARQASVAELRPRADLREEMALIGEDIRAAVDAKELGQWGVAAPSNFFPGARIVAPILATTAVVTLVLFFAHVISLRPFLAIVLCEIAFTIATRESVIRINASVSTPARELHLLASLLERLENEPFQSARLVQLKGDLAATGRTASEQIRRLTRLVEQMESAKNQFFGPIAAALLWIPQFAMAIEKWRREFGPHIGRWTAAIGEFEGLCALAGFAYERPLAVFPELLQQADPLFDAAALQHPLIPPEIAIANDVSLGQPTRLWIVSGSNMSGKSTLMRAIGLNAVLAWAGAPVTCTRLRISPLYIGASMRANDSLVDNRSRFYAEIERLRDIVNLSREGKPTLFLLDELLSGTNSHDRRIGAEALVRGLVERGRDRAGDDARSGAGADRRQYFRRDGGQGTQRSFRGSPGRRRDSLRLSAAAGSGDAQQRAGTDAGRRAGCLEWMWAARELQSEQMSIVITGAAGGLGGAVCDVFTTKRSEDRRD